MIKEREAARLQLLDRLHECFPDYTFEIGSLIFDDPTPYRHILANTKKLKLRLREEMVDDILWSKVLFDSDLDVDAVIKDMNEGIVECVRKELASLK